MNLEDFLKKCDENPEKAIKAMLDSNKEGKEHLKKIFENLDDYDAYVVSVSKDGNVQSFTCGNPLELALIGHKVEEEAKKTVEQLPDDMQAMLAMHAMGKVLKSIINGEDEN